MNNSWVIRDRSALPLATIGTQEFVFLSLTCNYHVMAHEFSMNLLNHDLLTVADIQSLAWITDLTSLQVVDSAIHYSLFTIN